MIRIRGPVGTLRVLMLPAEPEAAPQGLGTWDLAAGPGPSWGEPDASETRHDQ